MDETYLTSIIYFVNLLKDHQKNNKWTFELGRKYDKVVCNGTLASDIPVEKFREDEVRYFVERSTGNIYGARSNTTPHLGWYFGNLNRCHLWDWSSHHGVPTNDPDIRPFKTYGPFIHYRLI